MNVGYLAPHLVRWDGSENAEVYARVERAVVAGVLRGRHLQDAYERLFAKLDGTVVDLLVILGGRRPPGPMSPQYLTSLCYPVQELRVSLEHNLEKAVGENYKKAIDADNVALVFHIPNGNRVSRQIKFELRPRPGGAE